MPLTQYGATRAEWDHFLSQGLLEAMLPVVSNPLARLMPGSKLKSLGKVPSRMYQEGAGGIKDWPTHVTTAEEVAAWRRHPDHGICMRTAVLPSLDCDITDQELSANIRGMIDAYLPNLPTRTRGTWKFLCAFRMDSPGPKRVIKTLHGNIEFLGEGQQFIAAGEHTSGERYRWVPESPSFPTVSRDDFERLWKALHEAFGIGDSLVADVSHASRAGVRTGAVIGDPVAAWLVDQGKAHHIAADGRIDVTCPWEAGHSMGEAGDTSTSYWPAHTGGFAGGAFVCLHASCSSRGKAEFLDAVGYREDSLDDFDPVASDSGRGAASDTTGGGGDTGGDFDPVPERAEAAKPTDPYTLIPSSQFKTQVVRGYRIKKLLPLGGLAVLFGAPGSGKTFIALELAMCIQRGADWRGHRVRQGNVVYIAAEGASGLALRIQAYDLYHGDGDDMLMMRHAPNMLDKEMVKKVLTAIHKVPDLALIVIDTLAQVTPGANENASEDMGKLIHHCNVLARKTGAMVMLVHHSGKDANKGARGHSSLLGATDVMLEVVRDGDNRCLTVVKQKDGEDGGEFPFRLNVVDLGTKDEDGERETSCVVLHNNESPKLAKGPKGVNQKPVFKVFQDLIRISDDGRVRTEDLLASGAMELLDTREPGSKKQDTRRQRAQDAIDGLIAGGYIEEVNGWYVLPRVPVMMDERGNPIYIEDMI